MSASAAASSTESDLRPELLERQSLILVGTVQSESEVRRLSFGQAGRITRIDAKEGDRVRRGQLLAMVDCAEANAELAIAEAELELQRLSVQRRARAPEPTELQAAKDRLVLAEEDFRIAESTRARIESAFHDHSLISKQELDAASRRTHAARLDVSMAQQALDRLQTPMLPEEALENAVQEKLRAAKIARARYQVSLCSISAPVSGSVVAVQGSPGEMAAASDPIIHVVEDGDRRAVLCLLALADEHLRIGQKLRLKVPALRDTPFDGVVAQMRSPRFSSVSLQDPQVCSTPCAMQAWVAASEELAQVPLHSIVYAYLD